MMCKLTECLFDLVDTPGIQCQKLLNHPPSHTSQESRQVRKAASGIDTIGAKALVLKLTFRNKTTAIAMFVLPGDRQFDAKSVLDHDPNVKKTRFLTAEEVRDATSLEIGAIPPFGRVLLPRIDLLFFDPSLFESEWVGFNAAAHEHSIIMRPADLASIAKPDRVFSFSVKPVVCDEIDEGRDYFWAS